MPDWITPAVAVLSIFVTFILGQWQTTKLDERRAAREQYDTFYGPFIAKVYAHALWAGHYAQLEIKHQTAILDLIMDNVVLLDAESVRYVNGFYEAFLVMANHITMRQTSVENADKIYVDNLNTNFNQLAMALLRQSILLSEKVHRPPVAKFALEKYSQTEARRTNNTL
jgi:hypothetical protein